MLYQFSRHLELPFHPLCLWSTPVTKSFDLFGSWYLFLAFTYNMVAISSLQAVTPIVAVHPYDKHILRKVLDYQDPCGVIQRTSRYTSLVEEAKSSLVR